MVNLGRVYQGSPSAMAPRSTFLTRALMSSAARASQLADGFPTASLSSKLDAPPRLWTGQTAMPLTSPRFARNARLQRAADNNPPIKVGEVGEAVAILQQALIDSGFPMPVSTHALSKPDGVYGSETASVVKRYQAKNRMLPDGVVGHDTLAALDVGFPGPPGPAPTPPPPPPLVFHPGINHAHSPSGRWPFFFSVGATSRKIQTVAL